MGLTEVRRDSMPPERFRELIGDRYDALEPVIARARSELKGRVIWHLNSTARGGGVAEMLRSYLAYVRGAGVDVRWMVTGGDAPFFEVTKRLHNNLHGDPGDGGALGKAERGVYQSTLADATGELAHLVRRGDVVFLHDPQTAGMVGPARELGTSVVWRCHVGVDKPNDSVRGPGTFCAPSCTGQTRSCSRANGSSGRAGRTANLDHAADDRRLLSEEPEWMPRPSPGARHDRSRPDGSLPPPTYRRNDGVPARVNRKATIVRRTVCRPKLRWSPRCRAGTGSRTRWVCSRASPNTWRTRPRTWW